MIGALCLSLISLAACSNNNGKTPTESKQEKKETKVTVDSIITEFKNAGLQAENPTDLPQKNLVTFEKKVSVLSYLLLVKIKAVDYSKLQRKKT